ncbi:MAG TPA: phenylacetate--CoA ligase family protein [Phycisphaerae bacterium]|nr:phenylacetate--CoA ligase family protein [Phycisphaerae bacterium]HPS52226.1 phenylacetate--CoA ligase family protein [Phycisphaerae bacterium]
MTPFIAGRVISPLLEFSLRRNTFGIARQMEKTQWLTTQKLRDIQLEKLRSLVGAALEHTEYYAKFAGVDKSWRPASLDDIRRLPLMDKLTLNSHREELTNRTVRGGVIKSSTGGSSGYPLIFYMDRRRQAWDKAARIRSHEWFGISHGMREAYVWNSPIELSRNDRLKHFRDWLINERLFAAYDLCEENIAAYVQKLKRFRPSCVFGYPSSMHLLCMLAEGAGLRLDDIGVKVVFSTAEVLYEHQREVISRAFGGVPVADGYGSREAGFIAHQCPYGGMHITSENVIVEILRNDGTAATAGEDGEIVVTQLDNYAMPFIRYRTEDVGQLRAGVCRCGRGLELMQVVQGRCNDFLITPHGRRIHSSAVHAMIRVEPGVVKFQVRQAADGSVKIMLVTDEQFSRDAGERIRRKMLERLGPDGIAAVEYCKDIPLPKSGKYRYVISELSAMTGHED